LVTKRRQLDPYTSYAIHASLDDEDFVRSKIVEALEKLAPDSAVDGMVERYIDLAREYVKERLAEPPTRAEITSQLARVKESAERLADTLARLGEPAAHALSAALSRGQPEKGPRPLTIAQNVEVARRLRDAASSPVIAPSVKLAKGPAARAAVMRVAEAAANDYYALTGREPKRGKGGFVAFLEHVFEALPLREKPSAYVQKAVDRWKREGRPP
jgi:hypothetical protein